ncbi:adenosylhomocysteine nucleosidase [Clostridium acetobutylicum]|uniref:adenosylhomocysteine nucleosidase n=1 Tax=Clostridium acetobutylicum (strain ATCC 824 / DSM 792 / JCM 1419 / IAM 19013 / LMG 5710 / NBRC 13948 / NRRL B-527 / VKM B-1787 / 2291 / W) TaxID=272562 RepID=Q97H96_CLOAB|nr:MULTISPECIES: 5'-methylthioadenosine/adenosylhomocysteine nucleosidase [Clostridium]AAK80075.1 Nucleoside phosphorylase [Clostridium acetobutylicum ATCC 824]ADZ21168.1 5'-methylthioadenosine/S-adenosylhomocysteine nucleosidase [Clostridium acetobutylicum EA 2018]AEI33924.1 5'-methylthioadenosine/S-adenosylhomocysteine nucleosidase [Clostridium acetobutylicum DSM 1731]AWV79498.1 5'-methylthioadenosine/adenosylhomocysteine nucleosidase [Clostridium acetobutylicum]MBC2394529.1 5'-methylthioade
MTIGIIGAMDEELEILLKEMEPQRQEKKAEMIFNLGKLSGKNVVIVRCGIGKVNAAICTQILADDFNVDFIINVGVAGGIGKDILPGDIVIANSLVQHDMDTTAFGDRVGQIPRLDTFDFRCSNRLVELAKKVCESFDKQKAYIGRIATGDQFVADIDKIKWLSSEFDALACEMEGGSIAHTAYLNNIPFVVIRSISDNANNGAHMDYEKFLPIAIKNSSTILKNMISLL